MTALRWAAAVLCSLGLLACSSGGDTDAKPGQPTTKIDVNTAREQYLAVVEQPNESFAEFTSLSSDEARIRRLPEVADELEALARELATAEWPEGVQHEIDEAVAAVLTLRTAAVQLSNEPHDDQTLERFAEATTDFGAAGAAVRLALGLPLNDQ